MTPWLFLLLLLLITAAVMGWSTGRSIRRRRQHQALARRWSMQFSAMDRFGLTERLSEGLPCPGAADVYAYDVMYGLRGDRHCYVCTVEYTQGVIHTKRRRRVVARITEPRQSSGGEIEVTLASTHGARAYHELVHAS